ncbi:class I SAM-dependent methyltransferase [Halotia wernerae UHCC 0503]|nr:class I SAM-dependent methyltransferase [Halotia wernerae UHCC 0503]
MTLSRLTKVQAYFSLNGLFEVFKDIKYLFRSSFLGLPRIEFSEIFDFNSDDFKVTIPNYAHGSNINASILMKEKMAITMMYHFLKPKTVIEIGTFRGETTDLMAHNLIDADIYTLDLPPESKSMNYGYQPEPLDLEVIKFRKNDAYVQPSYTTKSRVHQIYGDSAEFDFKSLNTKFDLAFIDGAHSYDYVKNDTEKLLPLMNPGGWIIWDDYWFLFPGVIKYVNTFRKKGALHIYGTRLAILKV